MAAKKAPAAPKPKIEAEAHIRLELGDNRSDQANIALQYRHELDGMATSGGMHVVIHLPEGAVLKDRDAAEAEAKRQARAILSKMSSKLR